MPEKTFWYQTIKSPRGFCQSCSFHILNYKLGSIYQPLIRTKFPLTDICTIICLEIVSELTLRGEIFESRLYSSYCSDA